jgi:hypothetical protein
MWNSRRGVTGWTAAMLALGVATARADAQLVTLNYVRTDIRKAISMLQTVSDLRVVIDPMVPEKRITLSLKDLAPEDALRTVATAAGLSCRKVGNGFIVEPKATERRDAVNRGSALRERALEESAPPDAAGLGGIIRPDAPAPALSKAAGPAEFRFKAVDVPEKVLEALERQVAVDVKNGPLSAVTDQLSRSSGVRVTADPSLAEGLVATVALHGIPLKSALELVAGQTALQISPRPDGVAFVSPGLSLDRVQTQVRQAPAGAQRVEQGQLWTAEWAKVLTSGVSPASEIPGRRSLRRLVVPDTRTYELRPRGGSAPAAPPAAAPPAAPKPAAPSGKSSDRVPAARPAVKRADSSRKPRAAKPVKTKNGKAQARKED